MKIPTSECCVEVRTGEHYEDVRASDLDGGHCW